MKIVKYLIYKGRIFLYLIASLITWLLLNIVFEFQMVNKWIQIIIILLFFLIIRVIDDYTDYDKDKKNRKQYLSKQELIIFLIFLCLACIILNIIDYGIQGFFIIPVLVFTIIGFKYEYLKLFISSIFLLEYVILQGNHWNFKTDVAMIVCIMFEVIFDKYKGRKNDNLHK